MKSWERANFAPKLSIPAKLKKSKAICHLKHIVAILQHRLPLENQCINNLPIETQLAYWQQRFVVAHLDTPG